MHHKNRRHLARNQISNRRRAEHQPFTPTLSVERPVLWKDETRKNAYTREMYRAFGLYLSGGQRGRHRPVKPEEQKLILLDEVGLAEQNYELHRTDKRIEAIERLAGLLQERLFQALEGSAEALKLPLGDLACQRAEVTNRDNTSKITYFVGASPVGWTTSRGKYAEVNSEGTRNASWQLALEQSICAQSLRDVNCYFEPQSLIKDPVVPLVAKRTKSSPMIDSKDFSSIAACLHKGEDLLQEMVIGDPMVVLKMGPRNRDMDILPIRGLSPLYLS